jgi:hypothetical protein
VKNKVELQALAEIVRLYSKYGPAVIGRAMELLRSAEFTDSLSDLASELPKIDQIVTRKRSEKEKILEELLQKAEARYPVAGKKLSQAIKDLQSGRISISTSLLRSAVGEKGARLRNKQEILSYMVSEALMWDEAAVNYLADYLTSQDRQREIPLANSSLDGWSKIIIKK